MNHFNVPYFARDASRLQGLQSVTQFTKSKILIF